MGNETREATPRELVQIAHNITSMRTEGQKGFQAAKDDLFRSRVLLDGDSIADRIDKGQIDDVISFFESRNAGNAT